MPIIPFLSGAGIKPQQNKQAIKTGTSMASSVHGQKTLTEKFLNNAQLETYCKYISPAHPLVVETL